MLVSLINWISVIYCMFFAFSSVKKILNNKYSILHIAVVFFFVMQVIPIVFEAFFGIDESMSIYKNMYIAMLDKSTSFAYCFFVMFTISCLYCLGNSLLKKQKHKFSIIDTITSIKINSIISFVVFIGMFVPPILAVAFSPDWTIYTDFSYFYTNDYYKNSDIYLYHTSVVTVANCLAFGFTIVQYLCRDISKKHINFDVFFAIVLFTWIDGKRTLLTFSLIGILAIDVLKRRYRNRAGKLLGKALVFSIIIIGYFIFYSQITGKGIDLAFGVKYELYYSRLSSVKTAIYDLLNGSKMLDYNGQSILYNILFFVPREFWENKPVMFCKYFTAYALGHSTSDFVSWNLLVNIWTEFIANFGFVGNILAIAFCYFVAKITENTNNVLVYLFGTLFILFYFVFGFEVFALIAYILWIALLCVSKFKVKIVLRK